MLRKKSLLLCFTMSVISTISSAIPNPASQKCIQNGGSLEIRSTASGAQYGVCMWDEVGDDRGNWGIDFHWECEEWSFFRNTCKSGDCIKIEALEDELGHLSIQCIK